MLISSMDRQRALQALPLMIRVEVRPEWQRGRWAQVTEGPRPAVSGPAVGGSTGTSARSVMLERNGAHPANGNTATCAAPWRGSGCRPAAGVPRDRAVPVWIGTGVTDHQCHASSPQHLHAEGRHRRVCRTSPPPSIATTEGHKDSHDKSHTRSPVPKKPDASASAPSIECLLFSSQTRQRRHPP
jgi:hypothetical protein